MTTPEHTLIIGAGPAGLAAAAALKKQGISPLVLEAHAALAQSWRAHYDALELNSAKWFSALPFMKMPADYPRYPSRDQMIAYFMDYAQRFDIRPRLERRVERVIFEDGVWRVDAGDERFQARHVVIATGLNNIPRMPEIEGLETFAGQTLHSHDFKSGADFRSERVLVVGAGNSAVDIAMDLRAHEAAVDLVVRGPTHVTPLDLLGVPAQVTSMLLYALPLRVADALGNAVLRVVYGDLSRYGIRRPAQGPLSRIVEDARVPMFDRGIIKKIKRGEIRVRPGVSRIEGERVFFEDGESAAFDVLVLATGYTTGLPALLPEQGDVLDARGWPRQTATDTGHGLYFIGFKESPRGLLNDIKDEALRLARAIAG